MQNSVMMSDEYIIHFYINIPSGAGLKFLCVNTWEHGKVLCAQRG